jgi:hypothetical protein
VILGYRSTFSIDNPSAPNASGTIVELHLIWRRNSTPIIAGPWRKYIVNAQLLTAILSIRRYCDGLAAKNDNTTR